ncbi:MAG TPA: EscU/YscU/HrcU family type III secretion system export apparatus switch protein [Polyangia bacterium]
MADSFSDEKTESPTPRRVLRARSLGRVAISRDLATAFAMATACVLAGTIARSGAGELVIRMREALDSATKSASIAAAAWAGLGTAAETLALPLGALIAVALLVGSAQTQGLATSTPLRFEARRILPSLYRLFGRDRAFETGRGVLTLAFLGCVAWWSAFPLTSAVLGLGGAHATQVLHALGAAGRRLGIRLTVAMLAAGVADYLWQRHRHGKALRMSRDEVKREHREDEGETEPRAERLRLHREFMLGQGMGELRRAEFVVVHPGVMAVAVGYDGETAPVVLVKGKRHHARAIEQAARTAGVPVLAEPELVHALATTEEGGEIPESLFEEVAELLVTSRTLRRDPN